MGNERWQYNEEVARHCSAHGPEKKGHGSGRYIASPPTEKLHLSREEHPHGPGGRKKGTGAGEQMPLHPSSPLERE